MYGSDSFMANFCGQKVSQCPDKEKTCARLKSTDPLSNLCRLWYANESWSDQDKFMQNYCSKNKSEYDCKCVNRSDNTTYNMLKDAKVANDACWYVPCANPSKYFVPTKFLNTLCPQNVCDKIYKFIKDNKINMTDVKDDITCDFTTKKYTVWLLTAIIAVVILFVTIVYY